MTDTMKNNAVEPYEMRKKLMEEVILAMNRAKESGYKTRQKKKNAG